MLQTTLGIIIEDGKIFLGEKKKGFAKGVLNGVGGKQESNESIEECMKREAREEISINIEEQIKVGILHFFFEEKKEWNQSVHLYNIKKYSGEIIESEEIKPNWFNLSEIPYDKMWKDDIYWLPRILKGETDIEYNFYFNSENGDLLKYKKIK